MPVFTVDDDGVEIEITVLSTRDLRVPVRTSPEGKPIERAKLAAVEALLTRLDGARGRKALGVQDGPVSPVPSASRAASRAK